MLLSLIKHSWLGFRRSDFFYKSMAVKALMAFVFLMIAMQLNMMGKVLPGLLLERFPQKSPGEWVYSFLILVMFSDLLMRFLIQKLPQQELIPYQHLPVSWRIQATAWLLRTVFNVHNVYLLFIFWPFIIRTINPEIHSQHLGLLGIFLLSLINNSIVVVTRGSKSLKTIIALSIIIAVLAGIFYFFPMATMNFSLQLFQGFVNGNAATFAGVFSLLILLNLIAFQRFRILKYQLFDRSQPYQIKKSVNFKSISHPEYGKYWNLEWKLINRSNRSKYNFWLYPLVGIAAAYYIARQDEFAAFAVIMLMVAGGYGTFHLQHFLSWESHFFDFLSTRDVSLRSFLLAKYYFYLFWAFLQFIIITLILTFLNLNFLIYYTGLFLYMCGMGYYVFMLIGVRYSSRFDPNGRSSFNTEGLSGMKFLITMGLYFSILPPFIVNIWFSEYYAGQILLAIIGLCMILFHKKWIYSLEKKFHQHKYRNLSLYRQK